MSSRALLHVVVASLICHSAFADSAIEPLVGFEMGPGNPGGAPLFLHSNGNFYSTSAIGGAFGYTNFNPIRIGYGTIFEVRTSGEVGGLSFENALGSIPGDTPNPTLILSSDGWLWGSTTKGALTQSNGTVFRIQPETGTFQTIYNVSGAGTLPVSNLVRDPATGRMWGTAGATTFSINELTGAYTAGGVAPTINASEVDDGAGFRWGITAAGGTSGNGTIYKTEIATSTTTTVVNFSGTTGSFQGKTPQGPLVKDGGFLWGVTREGGSGTSPGLGVIFKLEIATGTYTAVVRFGSLTGVNAGMNTPSNALAADGKGYLWGFASPGIANGANGWSLYKIKTSDGSLTRVSEFGPGTNNTVLTALNNAAAPKGRMPYKGLTGSATSPYLWGTTSEGGTKGFGTLFRYDPSTRHYEVMVNFTGTTGAALGGRANGRLHIDENGVVWGTTEVGGTGNSGTVFKFDPVTRVFTTIHSFNLGGNGGFPRSGLVDGGDGFLWGTASSSPNGVIYRVNKSTNALGVAYAFTSALSAEGATPEGDLLLDGSGNLWGTTTGGGGGSNNGVLYKFVPSTLTYTAMVKFSGADTAPNFGRQPSGPLVMDNSGNIWGTTIYNVFKYSPGSATYTNVFNYNENASVLPVKSVSVGTISKTAAGNIRFLGTEGTKELTTSGDTARMSYRAVVYEINPATNVTTKLHSLMEAGAGLAGPADLSPAGGLYEHTDGRFYGITKNSGVTEDQEPAGGGMIYRVSTGPAVMTQPYWTSSVTNFYTLVSNNTATLRGYANPNGNTITCEFEWGPTTALGNTVTAALSSGVGGSGNAGSIFSASLSDLTANTTYFYRFLAKTTTGEPSYGPVRSFVTGAQASYPGTAEIRVESPLGQSLTDNVGSLDLGQLRVGQSVKQAVIVRNISAVSLTGLSASISGGNASDFVITRPLSETSLSGTVSDGLLITFTPSGAGPRSTTLTITSNDSDEASFEIQLAGEGIIQPEIEVEAPAALALSSGGNDNFGSSPVSLGIARTFTIRNTGNAPLTGVGVSVTGANSGDFVLTTAPAASVAADGSTTFTITFTPSLLGARSATLEIANDDADENPFYIHLSGTGVSAPEIDISPVSQAFGNVNRGSSSTLSVTVRNLGNATLNLSRTLTGTHAFEFSTSSVPTTLAPAGQAVIDVTFTPTANGARSASLNFTSNDSDEATINIPLTGTGTSAPEISVESPQNAILTDGVSSLDFGSVNVGSSGSKAVYIRNPGSADLTGLAVSFIGTHASDFSATTPGSTSLTPNDATGFVLTFTPSGGDARTATMRIASNDADENPFDIALTGTGNVPLAPTFTVQPQSRLVLLGQSVSFNPTVTGAAVMTYRWKKGTALIKDATASSYGIAITKAADAGAYSVVADNPVGAEVPSNPAYLGLVTLSQGTLTLKAGTTLSLKCTVVAPTAPNVTLSYSWRRSGDPLSNGTQPDGSVVTGADKPALSITKLTTLDSGNYTCLVTLNTPGNDPSTANGDTAVRVVDAVPDVGALPPQSVSVSEPIDITLTATNFPTSFSASALPAGLKFDTKTGRLTGKPTSPSKKDPLGAYIPSKISFKATNPFGTSVAEDFYLTIEPLEAGVVGTFSGLVARSGHSNFGMGGHVKITVAASGIVTGDVTLAGQKHSLVGSLNVSLGNNPTFDLIVKRAPASLGDLRFTGNISPPDDLLSGTITDDRFEMLDGMIDLGDPTEPDLINGTMQDARFRSPRSLVLRPDGAGYVADTGNHVIRFVDPDSGEVSTFVGNPTAGSTDGTGTAASFNGPEGLALDNAGNLFIADTGNSTIRKVTPAGVVTTFAGAAGQVGITNGTGTNARFSEPCALCFDPAGNLYVADRGNHMIRKITPAGVVTTLAGKADAAGHKEGSGIAAQFDTPSGITYDPVLKALFVADSLNRVIRKVTLTGAVTTYAGSPRVQGEAEGLFANTRFIEPVGIASLGNGTLIVADVLLVQLNPNGTSGVISEMLDTVSNSDNPTAIAYNADDESFIVAQGSLHSLASYQADEPRADALVSATRNPWITASNAPEQGLYNAAITISTPGDISYPQGSGYAQVSISKTGTANWTGKAADGTAFTFSTFLDADLHIPLHASLYKNTGSLQGDTFINPTTKDLVNHTTPAFDWYKIPQPLSSTDRSYKNGFYRHELEVSGGKYTPNDLHGYLGLSSSPTAMKLDFTASLIAAFEQSFTLTDPNTVSITTPVKSTTLKIDPKTGIFTGSFKEGTPAVTVPFAGILIDYEAGVDQSGHGHHLLPESSAANAPIRSASMTLVPNVGP